VPEVPGVSASGSGALILRLAVAVLNLIINRLKDTFFLLNYNQGLARIKKQEWRDVIYREKPSREILLLMASLEISNPANSCIDL